MIDFSLAAIGDLHLRGTVPENRIDDYLSEQKRKLLYSFNIIPRESVVAFPGDVFNSDEEPYWVIEQFTNILNSRPDLFYLFVAGQHDMHYHSTNLRNTPLKLLVSGVKNSLILNKEPFSIKGSIFYGKSWGGVIPKGILGSILIMHKTIIKNNDIPGLDAIRAKIFLQQHPFSIVISGDNHEMFVEKIGKKRLVNMGSFMRIRKDQKDHAPAIYIFHNGLSYYESIPIKENVFDNEVKSKKVDTKFIQTVKEDFVKSLKEENKELEFVKRLRKNMKEEKEEVKDVIKTHLEKVENG